MVVDLSLSFRSGMPSVPGLPEFESDPIRTYRSDGQVVHGFTANTHLGTHVDAPGHFIEDGKAVDEIDPDRFVGEATVVDLRAYRGQQITAAILEAVAPALDTDRVVLLTGDVDRRFEEPDFFETAACLTEGASRWLLDAGVDLVANDFLTESIEADARPVHRALLGEGVPVVEYLCNATAIADEKTVELYCQPLKFEGLDGAPTRVLARRDR